ncbi:MAG: EscU/YscU/HrcU family type III secretion system export apparatus switch protein [Bacillota bacterium]|nr:EscU/YscU/HrcU family type III secretion system export apparatus switch protein [Bacillota bacterium]
MKEKNKGKVKEAAALRYSPDSDRAPKIVAVGKGEIAEKIVEKANESDVPIYQDEKLAHTLNSFNLGDEIPSELYEVVAEILVFIGNMDRNYGDGNGKRK